MKCFSRLPLLWSIFFCAFFLTGEARAWTAASLSDLRRTATAAPAEGLPERTDLLAALTQAQRGGDADLVSRAADRLFDALARDFSLGAVSPGLADPDRSIPQGASPNLGTLHQSLSDGARPSDLLPPLLPQTPAYAALRKALADIRAMPPDQQDRNSQARAIHLRASLERWRWLPRNLPERRVEVWIPQYETIFRDGPAAAPLESPAIVGRPRTPTPRLAAVISSVTLNPVWQPPASIVRELLPGFRRDPKRAAREGFEVTDKSGAIVAPDAVDWRARPFPYRLRQLPGPFNPLGQIRFNLPNGRAVYLHDTSNRSLLNTPRRAYSHGCVRVGKPMALGAALLGPPWNEESLQSKADQGRTDAISIPQPTPIFFLYFTATLDEHGQISFAEDIYFLDKRLIAAMDGAAAPRVASVAPLTCSAG